MILEAFLLFTKLLLPSLSWPLSTIWQSSVKHSDNMDQPAELAMEEHGFE